jgi:hypothetical protein
MYSAPLLRPFRAWPDRGGYPGLRSFLAPPRAITYRAFGPERRMLNLVQALFNLSRFSRAVGAWRFLRSNLGLRSYLAPAQAGLMPGRWPSRNQAAGF